MITWSECWLSNGIDPKKDWKISKFDGEMIESNSKWKLNVWIHNLIHGVETGELISWVSGE